MSPVFWTSLLVALAAALPVLANAEPTVPDGGTSLLPDEDGSADLPWGLVLETNGVDADIVSARPVYLRDGPEDKPARALLARTKRNVAQAWRAQLVAPVPGSVEEGDVVYAEFWIRGKGDLGAESATEFVFEQQGEPWTKSTAMAVSSGGEEWTKISIAFESVATYGPGESRIAFRLGYPPQTLEIAHLRLLNFGKTVELEDLPKTVQLYAGAEPDAPWRAEAAERIDRLRKGDLTITLTRPDGTPVAGAEIEIEMTRHAFWFGTAIEHEAIFDDGPDGEKYREHLLGWFNYATTENELKQNLVEGRGIERAIETLDWLNEHDMVVRGHTLLWPGWHRWFLPPRIREGYQERRSADPEYAREWLAAELRQHLVAKAAATRGKVVGWDVANEVANNREVMEILGDTDDSDAALAEWFKLVKRIDPRAETYLNDYGIIVGGGLNTLLRERYIRQANNLIEAGAAPDAIGIQGHFFTRLTGPETVWQILDELHATGLPVEITEYDVISGDQDLDGQYTRDFLTACFAHEGVRAFIVWGFWEGRHWRPQSAFFRRDWTLRPTGEAWRDLVLDEWWTRESVTTDADGKASVRGFLGDYVIRVDGREVETTLTREGTPVMIELDE
jgi:GH35 family endo-1,4-beta-xylanase